jgi:hypothetical protein
MVLLVEYDGECRQIRAESQVMIKSGLGHLQLDSAGITCPELVMRDGQHYVPGVLPLTFDRKADTSCLALTDFKRDVLSNFAFALISRDI